MKKILIVFIAGAFFSCGGDYPQPPEEKVNQIYLPMGSDPDTAQVDTITKAKDTVIKE